MRRVASLGLADMQHFFHNLHDLGRRVAPVTMRGMHVQIGASGKARERELLTEPSERLAYGHVSAGGGLSDALGERAAASGAGTGGELASRRTGTCRANLKVSRRTRTADVADGRG